MKKSLFLFVGLMAISLPSLSYAEIPQVERYVSNPTIQGTARLKYLMWNVYDATLYTSNDLHKNEGPYALKLDYLLDLKGAAIAERSIKEMRQQGFNDQAKLVAWESALKNIFPDIKKGNSIIGIRDDNNYTIFYKNNLKIGQINDPEFTKCFFDIWLGKETSQPQLRTQLLGLN